MQKTMAWLVNNFRVGKKVWLVNDTEVSRTLAGVAYILNTGREINEYETGSGIYNRHRDSYGLQAMLEGIKHPDFFKVAFKEVMKSVSSGIIYKRKINHEYGYVQLHYDRTSEYRYENVSTSFNMYGPRTFLSKKKLISYLTECCLKPGQKILDVRDHDEDCDRMDEALDDMSRDWETEDCVNDLQNADWIEKRDYSVNYVFEKEKLLTNSAMAKNMAKSGRSVKGILTTEEMQTKVDAGQTIQCVRDNNVFFFTDDYCIGVDYLPKCFVPSSTVIPHNVAPREAFPDGIIKDVQDYIRLYENDKMQMNTVDEFINYLNATYSRATATV